MATRLLLFLCTISPALRRWLWRWWYSKLARQIDTNIWTFMNYGFAPSATETKTSLVLQPADEPDRLCIQLYNHVVSPVNLAGKEILEVGSGRGGGCSFMARYLQPKHVTGIDYSPQAVAFCQRRHQNVPNLQFKVGDAENLPFPDASFDVVVNVESSHCYGHVNAFFQEVARVLRPGGTFVYADLRSAKEMEELRIILLNCFASPWEKIAEEDITGNVAAALAADDERKRQLIQEMIPKDLAPTFKEFAGVAGGQVFQGLQKGEILYFRFAFQRLQPNSRA